MTPVKPSASRAAFRPLVLLSMPSRVTFPAVSGSGPWLSQFRFGNITVDGEKFGADKCTFVLGGVEYTYDEMLQLGRVKWPLKEACIVRVQKPGGLTQGRHTVSALFKEVASYVPARMDEIPEDGMMFGHSEAQGYTRTMIIV